MATVLVVAIVLIARAHPYTVQGVVIRQDEDARRRLPLAGVDIRLANSALPPVRSDTAGFFFLALPRRIRRGQEVTLRFSRPEYLPLEVTGRVAGPPFVVHMLPSVQAVPAEPKAPAITVANVRVRYSARTTGFVNVGSTVKSFEVVNSGPAPCGIEMPCSPDGRWKAAVNSLTLDAGEGNQFRNVRASCIAGPCPFTRVDSEDFSQDNRVLSVSVRDWSETATFLVEAEVLRPMEEDIVRRLYPVIFGRTLNFTLPGEAEGPSIEADVDATPIVFPLGPDLCLIWASCTVRSESDQTKVYRCELKAGYRFR